MKNKSTKRLEPIYKALEDADRSGDLIACLLSLENRVQRMECGPILYELHNSKKISLVSQNNLLAIEALKQNEFWMVIHPINIAIVELDCSYRDILRLVQTLTSKAGSDGAAGMPCQSLVKWCKAKPDRAKKIVSKAKTLDEICLSHCVFAIQGLGNEQLAFELLDHPEKVVIKAGIRSLGLLELNNGTIAKRIINKCFNIISTEDDQKIRSSAIETAFKTWRKFNPPEPYLQIEFIKIITNTNEEDELVLLSVLLFYHQAGLVMESINLILESLAIRHTSKANEILHWLDQAIYSIDDRWDLRKVIDVFSAQIPRLRQSDNTQQFSNFGNWVWKLQDNTSQLYSHWLISEKYELCCYLAEMLGKHGEQNEPVQIFRSDLPSDAKAQIFMAKKCIGFLWMHEITAASILLSIVKNGKNDARDVAEDLLFNPLLLSYSGKLRSFLEEQVQSSSKRISDCVERLLKRHNSYLKGLRQTDDLVEMIPTIEQRRSAMVKDRERNKDIQKQSQDMSIFSMLATRQTVLYGKQIFSFIYGADGKKTPSITSLSEYSFSAEFPKLSVIDPVGFNQMITMFRHEKRES